MQYKSARQIWGLRTLAVAVLAGVATASCQSGPGGGGGRGRRSEALTKYDALGRPTAKTRGNPRQVDADKNDAAKVTPIPVTNYCLRGGSNCDNQASLVVGRDITKDKHNLNEVLNHPTTWRERLI